MRSNSPARHAADPVLRTRASVGVELMREIKFRGWSVDLGKWVYGYYIPDMMEKTHSELTAWAFIREHRHDVMKSVMHEVHKETVFQYTGLIDKNGKEVYEGDIVRCVSMIDTAKMVVIFEEGEFRMVLTEKYNNYVTGAGFHSIRCFEKEVIGNIHEGVKT